MLQIFNTSIEVNYTVILNISVGVFFGLAASKAFGAGLTKLISFALPFTAKQILRTAFPIKFSVQFNEIPGHNTERPPPGVIPIYVKEGWEGGSGASSNMRFQILPSARARGLNWPIPHGMGEWLYPPNNWLAILEDTNHILGVYDPRPEPGLPRRYIVLSSPRMQVHAYFKCEVKVNPPRKFNAEHLTIVIQYQGKHYRTNCLVGMLELNAKKMDAEPALRPDGNQAILDTTPPEGGSQLPL